MKHTSCILISVILLLMVSCLFYIAGSSRRFLDKAYDDSYVESNQKMDILQFVEENSKYRIVKTDVFYIPFSDCTVSPISEEELTTQRFVTKISGERACMYPSHITKSISSLTQQKQKDVFDFRYCCRMYSNTNKIIQFSISRSSPDTIYVNSVPYQASFETIEAFLKLLPARDYELAIKEFGADINLPGK